MARVEPEVLGEAEQVFIAASLAEARQAEALLSAEGVDYVVQVELFTTSVLFGPRNGAAFYVASGEAEYCRSRLTASGLSRGVTDEQE